jgi:hypothetical protein
MSKKPQTPAPSVKPVAKATAKAEKPAKALKVVKTPANWQWVRSAADHVEEAISSIVDANAPAMHKRLVATHSWLIKQLDSASKKQNAADDRVARAAQAKNTKKLDKLAKMAAELKAAGIDITAALADAVK